jgi:hypothetical protein
VFKKMKKIAISPSLILRTIASGILLCSFASGIALYFFRIDFLELLPKTHFCLFHLLTGFNCPFCGTTRAFLALGQLKIMKAISFNPLSMILLAVIIIYLCFKKIPLWLQYKAWAYLFAFVVVITWAIRLVKL